MDILWVIIAAIVGMAFSIVVTQLSGNIWNWRSFWLAFIPGALNAAAWAVKQAFSGDLMLDIIAAVIGGFSLSTLLTFAPAMKIAFNMSRAQQTKDKN